MASNNRGASLESSEVYLSAFEQNMKRICSIVVDMVNRSGQFTEDKALAQSGPIIAELKTQLEAANGRVAHLEARLKASEAGATRARVDAEAHVARYTTNLEARNVHMVNTVTQTVEKMKRDAAARVAAAETHARSCIDEHRNKSDSQIQQLSRDLQRHIDMLGLARKHTGSVAHKLMFLVQELKERKRNPDKTLLADCLNEMLEELAEYRNNVDLFVDDGLVVENEPDWGPVPDDEGGALLNKSYGKSSKVISSNNPKERTNQTGAPASPSGGDTTKQSSREESSLFVDDQQSLQSDEGCIIKSEDGDDGDHQTPIASSLSAKRASDSGGRAGRGGKRQRTK
ncbi:uncharacterized protein FSUBG_12008 [Fusarium subglutinans]|uniref:Uncharacterized protein n=1 Tax=Gibberella subglutinans TaxID=42677 RepID=A0A8H5L7N8_GIBSU|nr:uncharacterized protein FSUBG_12008 [Fusarium subglutinans]KAF5586797.1 hypothetical protein FSUBG_12008 [Fusarium subglutinans]